jgi:hypothetical protein
MGMLFYEIMTGGAVPYIQWKNVQVRIEVLRLTNYDIVLRALEANSQQSHLSIYLCLGSKRLSTTLP